MKFVFPAILFGAAWGLVAYQLAVGAAAINLAITVGAAVVTSACVFRRRQ